MERFGVGIAIARERLAANGNPALDFTVEDEHVLAIVRPRITHEAITGSIGLVVGDLQLSEIEDDLSQQWPKCLERDERAFRVTTALPWPFEVSKPAFPNNPTG